jgi:ArsR family transcriptional regulator, arsenate/arsenite/antimonite-responsive transcriptional repressor
VEEAQIVRIAKALGDPTRFRILSVIAEQKEIRCSELTARFPIKQATVSHHLKVLTEAGLIEARHEGSSHYFRVNPGNFNTFATTLMGVAMYAKE